LTPSKPTLVTKVNQYLILSLPIVVAFAIISILYFDRPIAEFFFELNAPSTPVKPNLENICLTKYNKDTPEGFVAFIGVHATNLCYVFILPFFIWYFYLRLNNKKTKFNHFLGQFSLSLVFAFFIKSTLKYIFGRTSPLLEHERYLSFIADPNSYYFHFFDITGQGASFPSGHMCIFSALMLTISIYYKKLSPICLILAIGLFTGLLYFDLHYLSDLVVGTYIGITTALGLYLLDKTK
jgi:membrane-associated phospholipid phosphatase